MRVMTAVSASVIVAVLLAASSSTAFADLWVDNSADIGNEWNWPNWDGFTMGTRFTVGDAPLTVTALAYSDRDNDGLAASHQVALWNMSGGLLGEVVVPSGTTADLRNGWRWVELETSVTLDANTQYMIGGYCGDPFADEFRWINIGYPPAEDVGPEIASIDGRNHGFGFTFPDQGYTPGTMFNTNMAYVPEPATMTLLGLGGLGLLIRRKRN